jgi:hypothetical protein
MVFAIRRRSSSDPAGERVRLSEALREIQHDISFHEAMIGGNPSDDIAVAYSELVKKTRQVAGGIIKRSWDQRPISADSEMRPITPSPQLAAWGPKLAVLLLMTVICWVAVPAPDPIRTALFHRLSRIEGSYFGAGPRGVSAPPGPLISRFSRPNVGGPEILRKAPNERHFDLTLLQGLPQRLFSAVFEVSQKRVNPLDKPVSGR